MSLPWIEPSSLEALAPLFLFSLSTAGLVGVPRPVASFSPNSSLCFRIFLRRSSHDSWMASLSYCEKGRGGTLLAVEVPVGGGGSGDSGSSIASGDV